MNFKLITIALFACSFLSAQTVNKTYQASTEVFSNPERGFFDFSSSNSSLNQTNLTNMRLNDKITLLYRNYRLNAFKTTLISDQFLASMQSDFDIMRNAGIKCILRFTYSNNAGDSPADASKTLMLDHINQLKPYFLLNGDVIAAVQAGFIGTWGEWYYTSQPEFGGWGYNRTNLTTENYNHRKDILTALLNALPADRTVQLRYPDIKRVMYSPNALSSSQAFSTAHAARIGHHNDCFLSSDDDVGTYINQAVEYPYLEQETKFVPMGGESCDLNSPRTDCPTAMFEMNKFHWSYMNIDYHPDVINGFQTGNCYTEIQKNLGYRFEMKSATYPSSVALGSTLPFTLKIRNVGFAAPFNKRKAYIVLKNVATNQTFSLLMNSDPRTWLGPNEITINENIVLPSNLISGNYKMYLHLPDLSTTIAARPEYAIRMANNNTWESTTGYNDLGHTLNVTNMLSIDGNEKLSIALYPIPSSSELNLEMQDLESYRISFFNALGQQFKLPVQNINSTKMIADITNLSDGLYFIELTKGTIKDTRKFIVKH